MRGLEWYRWRWVFFIGHQEQFHTNSSVHSINTRNKHHSHSPMANLSCFQKGASFSGIRIFNNLPQSITSLSNDKPQFTVALKIFMCAFLLLCGWIFCLYRWYVLLTYMTVQICESQPLGTLRSCPGPYRDCFTFILLVYKRHPVHFHVSIAHRSKLLLLHFLPNTVHWISSTADSSRCLFILCIWWTFLPCRILCMLH